jgi:hypothetical protein
MSFIQTSLRQTLAVALFLTATCSSHLFAQSGTIDINNPSSGSGYTWNSPTLTIEVGGTYTITGAITTNHIAVGPGITANITLDDVSITASGSGACAFEIGNGSTVHLTLTDDNFLSSGDGRAGLQVEAGRTLVITEASTGSLTARGGGGTGAGIGGGGIDGGSGFGGAGGTITINGGKVTATGGGAGIGGGGISTYSNNTGGGSGGSISISGGTVIATCSSRFGAGIGGAPISATAATSTSPVER